MKVKKPTRKVTIAARPLRTIQASTFKATCLDLMDEVAASHMAFVVTKHGRPVVKVGPVDSTPPSPFGFLRSTVVTETGLVGPEHAAWAESPADPLFARKKK